MYKFTKPGYETRLDTIAYTRVLTVDFVTEPVPDNDGVYRGPGYIEFERVVINGDGMPTLQFNGGEPDIIRIGGMIEMVPIKSKVGLPAPIGFAVLQALCHKRARDAGWWDKQLGAPAELKRDLLGCRMMLMVSEISEAMEGLRKGSNDSHLPHRSAEEVELADAVIRILDHAGFRGFDLVGAIMEKLEYNRTRADHKPENRAKEGGKCF